MEMTAVIRTIRIKNYLFLEELEDLFSISLYNYLKPIVEDVNKIDSLAKRINNIATVP